MVKANFSAKFVHCVASLVALFAAEHLSFGQSSTYKVLYSFQGGSDGSGPYAGVTIGDQGGLYGTTFAGGLYGVGTIFKLYPTGTSWSETILHSFSWVNGSDSSDGSYPTASLVLSDSGTFYGTTSQGGAVGYFQGPGTVFSLTPSGSGEWTEAVLYSFTPGLQSSNNTPFGAIVIGPHGTLYTTASSGTVVAVTPPVDPPSGWTGAVIAAPEGRPPAGLVEKNSSYFGTTYLGGDVNCSADGCAGSVFQLSPPTKAAGHWIVTTIHNFGSMSDGGGPLAPLTLGPGGVFYGTTEYGGDSSGICYIPGGTGGCGTVFELMPPSQPGGSWTESVIYNFTGQDGDGAYPKGPVVVGKNGVLYGTTEFGGIPNSNCTEYGAQGCGIVFRLSPPVVSGSSWTETILHSFSGANGDGASPLGGLAIGSSGELYGTTSSGGAAGLGTVFVISPSQ
jgi:uncharacterized repeat protein (TIGR03803 family)